jgi:Na+-translocating ferredoxin:NAD+ oxidoreductase RnfG subunit
MKEGGYSKLCIRLIRLILSIFLVICIFLSSVSFVEAAKRRRFFRLLTKEEALNFVFPEVDEIVTETKTLSKMELMKIKKKLDGKLVFYQTGSKSEQVVEENEYTFYFGLKDGERIGMAMIEVQPGKWGPVEFIIAVDMDGEVKDVAVMSYQEIRGRPIKKRSFLDQYIGKTAQDRLKVGRDIHGISGATISSRCATFAVKKVLVMYEELFLKK